MRTAALFLVAAVASAGAAVKNADTDLLQQDVCNAYLWGLQVLDWTCTETDTANIWTCENGTDATLQSSSVDNNSVGWETACTKSDGTWISPKQIKGTEALCDAYEAAALEADANRVLTDAEKETIEWVTACGGLDGASALTAFGAAVIAAVAALAF